jgi:hypothetical protein
MEALGSQIQKAIRVICHLGRGMSRRSMAHKIKLHHFTKQPKPKEEATESCVGKLPVQTVAKLHLAAAEITYKPL